jgi:hypothetical protein
MAQATQEPSADCLRKTTVTLARSLYAEAMAVARRDDRTLARVCARAAETYLRRGRARTARAEQRARGRRREPTHTVTIYLSMALRDALDPDRRYGALRQELTAALEEYLARDHQREGRRARTARAADTTRLPDQARRDAHAVSRYTPACPVSMSYAIGTRQGRAVTAGHSTDDEGVGRSVRAS